MEGEASEWKWGTEKDKEKGQHKRMDKGNVKITDMDKD